MLPDQFKEIIQLIEQARTAAVKTVNTELINLYWNVGAYISNQVSSTHWGAKTVEALADFIQKNHPELKGFTRRSLYRMMQFYDTYKGTPLVSSTRSIIHDSRVVSQVEAQLQLPENQMDTIVSASGTQFQKNDIKDSLLAKLSWTHHRTIFSRCKTGEEPTFYLKICSKESYSTKELDRQISTGLYERTLIGNTSLSRSVKQVHSSLINNFKDTYVFEFLNLSEPHNEADLQKALITQMKNFILELGKEFLFVGEEYKLQVGNNDFYIDLLFFHRSLQCLVAFELKADKFKPEHLGQLNFYLEALDRDVKKEKENPSIGILLCKDKDKEVVEYAMSRSLSPTMVSEYKLQLPDKRLLRLKLRELFELHN